MPARRDSDSERKDRLIQTRVPRNLEVTLKAEARERRLSVSQLIRNVLEDTFDLVDGVVADANQIVNDSVDLARNVQTRARRLASPGRRDEQPPREGDDDLSHVAAWNQVILNRPMPCARCDVEVPRGGKGFVSVSDEPGANSAWLCPACVETL